MPTVKHLTAALALATAGLLTCPAAHAAEQPAANPLASTPAAATHGGNPFDAHVDADHGDANGHTADLGADQDAHAGLEYHGGGGAHADAYGDDHGGSPNLFAGTILQSIAAIVAFLLVLLILKKKAWGPILTGLADRENKIRTDLENAERASRDAERTLSEYKAQLAEARKEAQHIVAEARTAAQSAAHADKAKIEAEVATLKAAAKADIAAAKEQALTDLYAQTASLSTAVAGKILQREINADDQQQLINDSLAQFKANQG